MRFLKGCFFISTPTNLTTKLLFIPIFFGFLLSCSHEKSKLVEVGSVSYQFRFPSGNFKINIFDDKEYVAFADFVTNKEISVFDIDGFHKYSIDLESLMIDNSVRFISFTFQHPDTLLLLGRYNNKVYQIDKSARLLKIFDYAELVSKNVELLPPVSFSNGILKVGLVYAREDIEPDISKREAWIANNMLRLTSPVLFIDSNVYDTLKNHTFQFKSFYERIARSDQWPIEGNPIKVIDSLTVLASSYSDSIFIYVHKLNLIESVQVASKYTDISLTPRTYEEIEADDGAINATFLEHGFISDIHFDRYRQLYYCFVRHKANGDARPFSIIVYSDEFKKLDEFKMDEIKYFGSAFVAKKGFYLLNNDPTDRTVNRFTIFNYAKK